MLAEAGLGTGALLDGLAGQRRKLFRERYRDLVRRRRWTR